MQFATKGFVIDSTRPTQPEYVDRLAQLREIIRDIRSDEANVYRELRRICAMCQGYDGCTGIDPVRRPAPTVRGLACR